MADDNDKPTLTRRRVLGGIGAAGIAAGGAGLLGSGTFSQFTDNSETFTSKFTAGTIDGTTTYTASYNGNQVDGGSLDHVEVPEGEGNGTTINFTDVKPGDRGSITLTITENGNPAWVAACLNILNSSDGAGSGNGELDNDILIIPFYSPNPNNEFFDFDGPDSDWDGSMSQYAAGTSSNFWNSREGTNDFDKLEPMKLRKASNTGATDTQSWEKGNEAAPDGTTVDNGCILLDGGLAENDTNHDAQGVSPLEGEKTLHFGYDWHLPFTTGNGAQGDSVTIQIGTMFTQVRSAKGPYMPNVFRPENVPDTSVPNNN